jgi:serine phosphatase RsbU (regulator of sigma subunit)
VRNLQEELAATSLRLSRALHEMQDSLLPTGLPTADGYTVAVRHLPADSEVGLGGDWYDVLRTTDGHLVASIGDVVGHGVEAIGAMARASSALRAYVSEGHAPDHALAHLDRLLGATGPVMATAAVMSVDPGSGEVCFARAGHPYPLVVGTDGAVRTLTDASGPMLGALRGAAFTTAELVLEPGETVVLHTDGLVERRGESPSASASRLAEALSAGAGLDLDGLADLVLDRCLVPGIRRDDACLLLVRREATPAR